MQPVYVYVNIPVYVNSMEGGELFNRIQDRADSAFTERGNINSCYFP